MSVFRSRSGGTKMVKTFSRYSRSSRNVPGGDRVLEVLVGRGDQPHVDLDRLDAAQPLELALLDDAQQLDLDGEVHLADLVEQERAAVGALEPPLLARRGAGERPFLVAEELRFDERVRQGRAAHLDERLGRPLRVVVNRLRDQLLAGARLAADEDGGVGARDLRHLLADAVHRAAGAQDVREVVALAQFPLQPDVLLDQPLAIGLDQALDLDRVRDHRGDDAEELAGALVVSFRLVAQLDRQHARRPAIEQQRDADERALRIAGCPLAERGLAADPRDDHGTAGREHLARQRAGRHAALPGAIASRADRRGDFERQLIGRRQRDGAADGVVRPLENLEHALQRRPEVRGARQRLAHLQQGRQLADLAALRRRAQVEVRGGS